MKKKDFKNYNSFALVTGAASGMGKQYALELAGRGYNLVLVDINATNLECTAEEVRETVNALDADCRKDFRVMTVVQGCTLTDAAAKVAEAAKGLDIEVLVNNAGIMFCQEITGTSRKALSLIMMLHMYTPLMLCREIVPKMKERGCGYVLNISSLAAWMEWPP